jgi:hypothetical protein
MTRATFPNIIKRNNAKIKHQTELSTAHFTQNFFKIRSSIVHVKRIFFVTQFLLVHHIKFVIYFIGHLFSRLEKVHCLILYYYKNEQLC